MFVYSKTWIGKQSFAFSWERVQQVAQFFATGHVAVGDHEGAASLEFEVANKFQQVVEFTVTESMNNEGQLTIKIKENGIGFSVYRVWM